MCRILAEIQAPLSSDAAFSVFNNLYDRRGYKKLCSEFGVSPATDWRQKLSLNNGLGLVYVFVTNIGYQPYYLGDPGHYNVWTMSFADYHNPDKQHRLHRSWTTFIPDESHGFTHAGVERINDSIRTYVWAVLGSQAQTRSNILGTGTTFDAQKQVLANIEDHLIPSRPPFNDQLLSGCSAVCKV